MTALSSMNGAGLITGKPSGAPTNSALPKSPVSPRRCPVAMAEALGVVTVG